MATVIFTQNIQRHVPCPTRSASGKTVAEVLEKIFAGNRAARDYVLDDQGGLRKNMAMFIDGELIVDRQTLSDAVKEHGEIYIMQALSGG